MIKEGDNMSKLKKCALISKVENFDYEICHPSLTVQAMRSSGYKNTAHALAELIDNSIQAGLFIDKPKTNVEVLCSVNEEFVSQKTVKRIQEIAVYDNASGMSPEIMRIALQFGNGTYLEDATGISKFGMGLPNSSLSQCCHVEVYSWQNSQCFHTYLDLDEIRKKKMRFVPKPEKVQGIPKKWQKMILGKVEKHGTLVVWSKLDKLKWKTPKALFENSELVIGRMYRYFIRDNKASIRMAAYFENDGKGKAIMEKCILPNDPLYLMTNTCAPKPFNKKPAFVQFGNESAIKVEIDGKVGMIRLLCSVCTEEPRELGGHHFIGKSASKNIGISLVRANRELEMNMSFVNSYDPRERWWGCEVLFDSLLDEVFGVANTKQSATSFYKMDLDEDAKNEGMTASAFLSHLKEMKDPRVIMYELSKAIEKKLSIIREQIDKMGVGKRSATQIPGKDSPEAIGTEAPLRVQDTQRIACS